MNDKELFELEEMLEHPDVVDELCEEDFHRLAEVYHRNCVNRLSEKILSESMGLDEAFKTGDRVEYDSYGEKKAGVVTGIGKSGTVAFVKPDNFDHAHFMHIANLRKEGKQAKKVTEDELKEHPDYPSYRFHFDEAVRHYNARPLEIREEEKDRLIFSFGMDDRLQQVLKSAAKAMSGQLLKPEEQLHGTFD